MKYACQYAIVRFMPFIETGEFANVGIVLMCAEANYFDFQILNRVRRITTFFDKLDAHIYKGVISDMTTELNRVKRQMVEVMAENKKTTKFLFQELTRPREVMLRFDAPRVVLTDDPKNKLDELFKFYVERDFVTPEYVEKNLERKLRSLLVEASVKAMYQEGQLTHGLFRAKFPFIYKNDEGKVLKAIKPLHLAHEDPVNAYEHGWHWIGKLKQLKKYQALPKQVLIASQPPSVTNDQAFSIYNDIRTDFQKMDIQFVDLSNTQEIKDFAAID